MSSRESKKHLRKTRLGLLLAMSVLPLASAMGAGRTDWPAWGGDVGMQKFSPLSQITAKNVNKLKVAWTWHYSSDASALVNTHWEMTPLVIKNVMYFGTPNPAASIVALDATTGKELWRWNEAVVSGLARGLAYWPGDGTDGPRLVFAAGGGLMEVDAATGKTVTGFGTNGKMPVDEDLPARMRTSLPNPLAIYKNVIISGAITGEGGVPGPSGDIRAWDVKTGKLIWRFHTIPQPGEEGFETWPNLESTKNRPGANVWSMFSVDQKTGIVYAPIGSPGYDWYGGDRLGKDLYGNSVVALDALTGKKRWHFQEVHHDLNDYDATSGPTLLDIKKDGKTIPALAQSTKTGLIFFLNRLTGEPVFGVEERPIPQSTTPGEQSSPTQPFPIKPLPLARTSMTENDLGNLSDSSHAFCKAELEKLGGGSNYFTPMSTTGTVEFPGTNGGSDWGGLSYNPALGYVFANITNVGVSGVLEKQPEGSQLAYKNGAALTRFVDQDRYPCQKPPWGEMVAVNVRTGDIAWHVPLGSYAEMEAKGFMDYGAPSIGGSITTGSGLVFIAATNDKRFRAFDGKTGTKVWQVDMPASGNATPVTYAGRDGKQYVAITSSGPGNWRNVGPTANDKGDSVMAYSLGD
jgi:glucose dehydrogenase